MPCPHRAKEENILRCGTEGERGVKMAVIKEYLRHYGYLHSPKEREFLSSLSDRDVAIIGGDLYIFDPANILSIALGRMANGWSCLCEDWEKTE